MTALSALSATEQRALLESKACSSVELVQAHLDRIAAVDGRVRAFTEVFAEQALDEARMADELRAKGATRGPLHGIPISMKESVDIAGRASTMGVASRRSLLASRDGGMVEMARKSGAIILGRTNVSQYLLYHESRNPLFGQTSNPFSRAHTPGGSSGGEGAAIAAGMTPLGIGTDIGGSIRVPAHFCGIAGLKPTLDRWTNRGSNTSLAGQEAVRGQIGPMARTVADLAMMMRAFDPVAMSAIDARVPPLPIDEPDMVDLRGIRVGVYSDDGFVAPSLATTRAIDRAASALRARGCTVVPFTPPGLERAVQLYFAALSSDGGAILERGLQRDEVDPSLASLLVLGRIPERARKLGGKLAKLLGQGKLGLLLDVVGRKTVDAFWALTHEIRAYRFTLTEALVAADLDLVLCPAHATPALPHGMSANFALAGSPSMLWNLVQFPAGVVPITTVSAHEARREAPRDQLERHARKVDLASVGLPIGVQVVGKPWREDVVLAAMAAIESEVRTDIGFPTTPVAFG